MSKERRRPPRRCLDGQKLWRRGSPLGRQPETREELANVCERLPEGPWTEKSTRIVEALARSLGVKTRTYIKVDRPSSIDEDDPDFYPEEGRDVREEDVGAQLVRARASQSKIWKIWEERDLGLVRSVIVSNLMRILSEVNDPAKSFHPESRTIVKETLLKLGLPAVPFLRRINSEVAKKIAWEIEKTEVEVWKGEDRREVEG